MVDNGLVPDDIQPHDRPDDESDESRDEQDAASSDGSGLPPELARMFESLTGGPVPPRWPGS